jgi:hypothetical protein
MSAAVKREGGSRRLLPISVVIGVLVWSLGGCASGKNKPTTRPTNMRDRQDAAMRDPFNYKPDMSRDVSGGGIGDLDREGLKKDLNNVFNP